MIAFKTRKNAIGLLTGVDASMVAQLIMKGKRSMKVDLEEPSEDVKIDFLIKID